MTVEKSPFILIMTMFAFVALGACKGNSVDESITTAPADTEKTDMPEATVYIGESGSTSVEEEEPAVAAPEVTAEPAKPKPSRQTTATLTYGGKETLYISTYGANGKVWGHVTMNGRTGRGTIHDDDENTYSITVTRHGGELFGIDQNGREYVFRL